MNFFKMLFCGHSWKVVSSNRYNILRADESKDGEVTLTAYICERCMKEKVIVSDRTYYVKVDGIEFRSDRRIKVTNNNEQP